MSDRPDLSTRAASQKRQTIQGESRMIGGGAVSGAQHDLEVKGQRSGAASTGKGDERPRLQGEPVETLHGRSGQGRTSMGDGSNRPRIQAGTLRGGGDKPSLRPPGKRD